MSMRLRPNVLLEPKVCYELWVGKNGTRESIYTIPHILAQQGIVNKTTGKPVTPQGVWRAASLYILEHPNEAKSDTVSILSQHGEVLDEMVWGVEMIAKARQLLSRGKYRIFLAKYPEYKQYE